MPCKFQSTKYRYHQQSPTTHLIAGPAVWRVEIAEDVQLVQAGEGDEQQVPHHQHSAELAVQLPAVGVRRHHQEHHRREQRQGGVDKTWKHFKIVSTTTYRPQMVVDRQISHE